MSYKNLVGVASKTPVTMKSKPEQVQSSDGAYVFQVDDWVLYERFLVLGTDGNTYYASNTKLTLQAIQNFDKLLQEDGVQFVELAMQFSEEGRISKNQTAILALAYAVSKGDINAKWKVRDSLSRVVRTASDLFLFVEYAREFRGWGRLLRETISTWYGSRSLDEQAYQMLKYQTRRRDVAQGGKGYSHKSLLKLAHVNPQSESESNLYRYVRGYDDMPVNTLPDIVMQYEELKMMDNPLVVAKSISDWNSSHKRGKLTHEFIPSQFKGESVVWEAMLPDMPVGALVRNLGRLTSYGVFKNPDNTRMVIDKLTYSRAIKYSRLHPVQILNAMIAYEKGASGYGRLSWLPHMQVQAALEDAFYLAFDYVKPINKRMMIALDISGSMDWENIPGLAMNARQASVAMAMTYIRTELDVIVAAFSSSGVYSWRLFQGPSVSGGIQYVTKLTPKTSLIDAYRATDHMQFGATYIALPMMLATQDNLDIDLFMIYTDNELNVGAMHPHQALEQYRQKSGINAGMVVNAMVANNISIADPNDPLQLDVAGFDASVPRVVREYYA